ncbi:hypothetical protein BV25DRAFT_1782880, partial [Artomyces pyxidatus]
LVRDMWPAHVGRMCHDTVEFDAMTDAEKVPGSFEDLCDWAYVIHDTESPDHSRQFILLYQPSALGLVASNYSNPVEVCIRFQGFLSTHNLSALGNWNGDETSAPKAIQFLNIVAGRFPEVFAPQKDVVQDMRTFLTRALLYEERDMSVVDSLANEKDDKIYFQRRVFKKVLGQGTDLPSILTGVDDPYGRADAVIDSWRVVEKIAFGRQTADGRLERCNPLIFRSGDFVDVSAKVDIINIRTKRGVPTIAVHMAPVRVI